MQGCASTRSISDLIKPTITIVDPDRKLLEECLRPVRLPKGPLTQSIVEKLWISDRKALIQCGEKHKALKEFIINRDNQLRGSR